MIKLINLIINVELNRFMLNLKLIILMNIYKIVYINIFCN